MYILIVYYLRTGSKKKVVRYQSGCYTFDSMNKATSYVASCYDTRDTEFELYDVTKIKPRILKRKVVVE